jgi:hypothetical protein
LVHDAARSEEPRTSNFKPQTSLMQFTLSAGYFSPRGFEVYN